MAKGVPLELIGHAAIDVRSFVRGDQVCSASSKLISRNWRRLKRVQFDTRPSMTLSPSNNRTLAEAWTAMPDSNLNPAASGSACVQPALVSTISPNLSDSLSHSLIV